MIHFYLEFINFGDSFKSVIKRSREQHGAIKDFCC